MVKWALFLLFILLVSGCRRADSVECLTDSDCSVGGCSGQICTTKEKAASIITTCEWKEEYMCYQKTRCSCINGICKWEETKEFVECVGGIK